MCETFVIFARIRRKKAWISTHHKIPTVSVPRLDQITCTGTFQAPYAIHNQTSDLLFSSLALFIIFFSISLAPVFSVPPPLRLLIPTNWTAQGALIVISFAKSDGDGLYMVIECFFFFFQK